MNIKCLDDLVTRAKKSAKRPNIAVVEAHDLRTLEAITKAAKTGIITPKLIGNEAQIISLLAELGASAADFMIIPTSSVEESLDVTVKMISSGDADVLMKGKLESANYLRAIVKKENKILDKDSKLSVTGLFSLPNYHKLLAVSDPALNTCPDLDNKKAIVKNAVTMLRTLGYKKPKVAILTSIEKLNPKMPDTIDADALMRMNQSGEIADCVIEGPISLDLALSVDAAEIKGYESPVAGDADLLIVPDITSGNLLVKCMTSLARAQTAGCILGAKVPAILVSRSAEASDRYYSIALAACLASGQLHPFI
ncbi:MAG: phosphate acyltransferase [Oscillospiraceae bacterium]|nr:phosphate acyltransferase [Oscillospiraceae bacterium]